MFSVEDLLISQGYKQSKNPSNSSENPSDRVQNEDTGRRSGQATRNGVPIHPGAIPKTTNRPRSYQNNNKNNDVTQRSEMNVHHEDFSGPEEQLYDQSPLSRPSSSKTDKDLAYRRRQGQDFSVHGHPDRLDSETKGMSAACALFEGENEGLENMRVDIQETIKPPGDYRWQSLKPETRNQPTAFGRCESDTDNKERLHRDVYSGRQDSAVSLIKNKSLPRVRSPENSNSAEIPSLVSSKHHKVKPDLKTLKHFEPATKPKYGRPLKPPSYEFLQQTRGILETNPRQEEQQKQKMTFSITKVNEDPTLEPPLYIPPPCYKSPGQQSKNQDLSEEESDYDTRFIKEMQVLEQSISISSESSINQLETGDEEHILYSSQRHVSHRERHLSSVQYIPFDDPRIRHIKVIHPAHHQMEDQMGGANSSNSNVFHSNSVEQDFSNSDEDEPDSINIVMECNQASGSSRWLVESDVDNCALSTQRGSYDTGSDMSYEYPKDRSSAQSSGATTELSSETLTKVKTFEPGTEIQGKNNSKKKTNETIFCLVSVPVQSELNMPDSDRNKSVTQGASEKDGPDSNGNLKEQSFLSTSSTDLELQTLTGNMINENELPNQEFQRKEFKELSGLSCKQPAKHKQLQHSGSWPCDRYKDQQTQTSFEEIRIQPLHSSQPKKSNTLTNGHLLKYGASTTESDPSILPTGNKKNKPIPPPRKPQGHLNKPNKAEISRTIALNPKAGQNVSRASSTGLPGKKNKPSFAHKEERKSPCSSKEIFGQFLLKPVSRRPWDAISELESFNKEIQKQEESSDEDKENEKKQEREYEERKEEIEEKTYSADEASQELRCGAQSQIAKPVTSMFKKGINKSKPESENASKSSDTRVAFSDFGNVRSQAREMDGIVKEKKGNVGLKQKQENAKKIIKQALCLHPIKSNVLGFSDSENRSNPLKSINSREVHVETCKNKNSDKLKKAAERNIPALAPVAPLSLTKRKQGHSEPNLRSVGLDVNEGKHILDSSTRKIPSNESFQARAVRILGIEVAVESLTTDKKTLSNEDSDNMPQSSELSKEKILGDEMKTDMAASKGKQKSRIPKKAFIRQNILGSTKDQRSGKETLKGERCSQHHPDLSKHPKERALSLESVALPFAERKPLATNIEKKPRSASKMTVPRQGQVASAASRAAMDRLARMKEVDSVSRMRRLSIKNAESGEDRDDDKQLKGSEERGNDASVGHTELPRKLSQGSCVSKRIISLNEKERLDSRNTKKTGRDNPEVYDPSRVERV